jgi:16S rRNA (cytidine1402-2'-O)-methyltransferase
MSGKETAKKKTSPDYPLLARTALEASRDAGPCKLEAGLYVVATPIGNLGDISLRALHTLANAAIVACEDTRNSGSMLSRYGIEARLVSYHDHNADKRRPEILAQIEAGAAVALISDAGMPLIADPGFKLVRDCREKGLNVTVVPGANAALTALSGAGLPTDAFHFAGFLPPKSAARQKAIKDLAAIPGTLIFYEAPQRLAAALADLQKILGDREAVVARELTKLFEESRRGALAELAKFYAANDVKGEVVILVGGASEKADAEIDIDAMLKKALRTLSLRDAVAAVSEAIGIRKGDVYARALIIVDKRK